MSALGSQGRKSRGKKEAVWEDSKTGAWHYGKIPVSEYQQYSEQFNPVDYDPDAWVRMAKDAGMKYIVITAKHHDGFALFDTAVSDWNIVEATPYGKDVLKPLAEAARKHGIKLGFYYSQAQDWIHPGGSTWEGRWDPAQEGRQLPVECRADGQRRDS